MKSSEDAYNGAGMSFKRGGKIASFPYMNSCIWKVGPLAFAIQKMFAGRARRASVCQGAKISSFWVVPEELTQ